MIRKDVSYVVLNVDEPNHCMLVEYSSEGRESIQVSMRIPFEGENIESVIASYSPENIWIMKEAAKTTVEVGRTGTLTPQT